ncbi:MAG TPA: hypothetical protein DDX71_01975 [Ruminococcus sp.]|nr:hypothetical protein [Ruminococcus sp.]
MKTETFLDAVGMIDEQYLNVNPSAKTGIRQKRKLCWTISAAAAALIVFPLPVLTAFGEDTSYEILYHIAPAAAQTFKPVQKSCTDQGIEMTVISAKRSGNQASIYLAMHDTTGTCPDGAWDLFDSYDIHIARDMAGSCSFSEYDPETQTAYFIVNLETMKGGNIPDRKVTFSVHELLQGRKKTDTVLTGIDMNSIPDAPETCVPKDAYCCCCYQEEPDPKDYRYLKPDETPLCQPVKGVSVMGIGYLDGALHILTKYEDIAHADNHGFILLKNAAGETVAETELLAFCYNDADNQNSYMEEVIPVAYDQLADCTLYGEFSTTEKYVSGDWEVSFPLEE